MEFLKKITGKVAGLFRGVDTVAQKVEDLGAQIVTWERRREVLETEKAAAYSRLLDLREQELDGRSDPDGLAAARGQCADLDEQIEAVSRKILALHEGLAAAIAEEAVVRFETAQARLEAMEEERRKTYPAMAAALSQAVFLRDRYWGGPKDLPFEFSRVYIPEFDRELTQLQNETPFFDFLGALAEVKNDLERGPGTLANINFVSSRTKTILKRLRGAA